GIDYLLHPLFGKVEIKDLKVSHYEADHGFKLVNLLIDKGIETTSYSNEVNQFLRKTDLMLEIDHDKAKEIRNLLNENRETLLHFLKNRFNYSKRNYKQFFNERKLCLARDFNINEHIAYCYQGQYY